MHVLVRPVRVRQPGEPGRQVGLGGGHLGEQPGHVHEALPTGVASSTCASSPPLVAGTSADSGAEAVVVGAGALLPSPEETLTTRAAPDLKSGCLETASHSVRRQLVRRAADLAGPAGVGGVPVAVVERHEDDPGPDGRHAHPCLDAPAPGRDLREVALGERQGQGVGGGHLDPDVGRGRLQLRCSAGLGPGVELVQRAARDQGERVLLVGQLVRRPVLGALEHRPSRAGCKARYSVTSTGAPVSRSWPYVSQWSGSAQNVPSAYSRSVPSGCSGVQGHWIPEPRRAS